MSAANFDVVESLGREHNEIVRLRALLAEARSMLVHYSRYPPPLEDGNHQFYRDMARIDAGLEKEER